MRRLLMALTDIKTSIINAKGKKDGERVAIRYPDPRMRQFILDNRVYVLSRVRHKPIVLLTSKRDATPIDTDLVPEVIRVVQRCADQINGKRTVQSLATFTQLERMLGLAEILAKRKDNAILLPAKLWKLKHGEAGRWIHDAKTILIDEGMWDDVNKCEIPKVSRKGAKSGKRTAD